jgi:predicted  nucleic acid-binding Zn-ribbon protein
LSDLLRDKLDALFRLQDLDIMIREAQDPEMKSREEEMGFRLTLDKLLTARARLAEKVDPLDLRLYERIARRHHHGIVPVEERTCLGCYMALPTSAVSQRSDPDHLRVCENCGRILYWLE